MAEQLSHKASLTGHAIEDWSYDALSAMQFVVELVGSQKMPQYKDGGFFVFSNLPAGNYTLRISGEQFQTQEVSFTVPFVPLMLDVLGDDELVVVVKTVNAGAKKINFDPVILPKAIRARARVVADGFDGTLAQTLDAGKATSAKLNDVTGLAAGTIVRIIRDRSIRLRFSPYSLLPSELTRIVGKITFKDNPGVALAETLIRLTKVNGVAISISNIAGAEIATAMIGGAKVVLGAKRDVTTRSNPKGDYNLYFNQPNITNVTLEATRNGFQSATKTIAITAKGRHRVDFELLKA